MNTFTRRPSAFPSESELALSQTDEIRLKADRTAAKGRPSGPAVALGDRERRKRRWILYLVGFMVGFFKCRLLDVESEASRPIARLGLEEEDRN